MESPVTLEEGSFIRLDESLIRQRFNRAASGYARAATFGAKAAAELTARLEGVKIVPETILDLGCGPGTAAELLQKRYKKARVIGVDNAVAMVKEAKPGFSLFGKKPRYVAGDGQGLPFADDSFDLVVSSLALHWMADPMAAFREVKRVLKPEGFFLFVTVGEETCQELRECDDRLGGLPRVMRPWGMQALGDLTFHSGLGLPVIDRENVSLLFKDVREMAAGLKRLGAGNPHHPRPRGLTGKGYWSKLQRLYRERYGTETGELPATVSLLFGHAWKVPHASTGPGGSCSLPGEGFHQG